MEKQREGALAMLEEYDQYGVGTYLYQPSDIFGYNGDKIKWDLYWVQNKVTPFRAGDVEYIGE